MKEMFCSHVAERDSKYVILSSCVIEKGYHFQNDVFSIESGNSNDVNAKTTKEQKVQRIFFFVIDKNDNKREKG